MKDSQTARRPSNRTAQLTVWDVNKLNLTDGKSEGYFEVGQRFQVCTSLVNRLVLLMAVTIAGYILASQQSELVDVQ